MVRALLPFYFQTSPAVQHLLGPAAERVALLAVKAVLQHHGSVEVAFQQIRFANHHLAISSRVSSRGDLIVDIDVGDPRLAHHLVLEDDYRSADSKAREADRKVRDAERRLRQRSRRW